MLTDTRLSKHYLPTTSFAGGKNLAERRNWWIILHVGTPCSLRCLSTRTSLPSKLQGVLLKSYQRSWPVSVSLKLIEVPLDGIVRLHSDSGSSVHLHKKLERRRIVYSKSYHHRISNEEQIHEEPLEPSVEFIEDK